MKAVILILLLASTSLAQEVKNLDTLKWKPIKEMSGDIPEHQGLTVEVSVAQIARGDDVVKLLLKAEFPWGAPRNFLNIPASTFDVTSVKLVVGKIELNCASLVVKPSNSAADVYQFNGKRHKSKEIPFKIPDSNLFAGYFCERDATPVTNTPPKLKRKP